MKEKISIVVQGPFDNKIWDDFHYTDNYLKYVDRVVVSCYNSDDTKEFEQYNKNNDRVTLVKNECPTFHCNPSNIYVHAFSTIRGLEKVKTEFSIKIRSDQYFTQIDKIVKLIEEFPNKYLVCNVHTMKVKYNSWKVSDHLFGGNTSLLIKSCQQCLDWCHESNIASDKHVQLRVKELFGHGQAEHVFFLAYLKNKNIKLEEILNIQRSDVVRIMRENLSIIDINELVPYIVSDHGPGHIKYYTEKRDSEWANNLDELGQDIC